MPTKVRSSQLIQSRALAYARQRGRCYYCTCLMWRTSPTELIGTFGISPKQAARFQCTAEHLVARCDGGGDAPDNIVAACLYCNHARHERKIAPNPQTYLARVRQRVLQGGWHPNRLVCRLGDTFVNPSHAFERPPKFCAF